VTVSRFVWASIPRMRRWTFDGMRFDSGFALDSPSRVRISAHPHRKIHNLLPSNVTLTALVGRGIDNFCVKRHANKSFFHYRPLEADDD
jgi:hypothetical protein